MFFVILKVPFNKIYVYIRGHFTCGDNGFGAIGKKTCKNIIRNFRYTDSWFFNSFYNQSRTRRSADAKRIANVRQIASALEIYRNEKKAYPSNLQQLVTANIVASLPIQPTNPTKYCTTEQIQYKYTLLPNDDFKIDFCLGEITTGQFKPGMNSIFSPENKTVLSQPVYEMVTTLNYGGHGAYCTKPIKARKEQSWVSHDSGIFTFETLYLPDDENEAKQFCTQQWIE